MKNPNLPLIMLADNNPVNLKIIAKCLGTSSVQLSVVKTRDEFEMILSQDKPDIVLLDLSFDNNCGMNLLKQSVVLAPETRFIVMTDQTDPIVTIDCLKLGVFDCLALPLEWAKVTCVLANQFHQMGVITELNQRHTPAVVSRNVSPAFDDYIGSSPETHKLLKDAELFAKCHVPVLIQGEAGSGKLLLAHLIHNASGLSGSFVNISGIGLSKQEFIESLTTAIAQADEGTLFISGIDKVHISVLSIISQWINSNYINTEQIRYMSGFPNNNDDDRSFNVRWIFSTVDSIESIKNSKTFYPELYYRLMSNLLIIQPLSKRTGDIQPLLDHFLQFHSNQLNKPVPSYPSELINILQSYHFPGNVTELSAMVENSLVHHTKWMLSTDSFIRSMKVQKTRMYGHSTVAITYQEWLSTVKELPSLKESSAMLVTEALNRADNNQSAAARMLGISRQAINSRIHEMEMENKAETDFQY